MTLRIGADEGDLDEACGRVAATCTSAFILAEAGLLDSRRATTHWSRARDLQARFPKVKVEEDRIFVVDGPVWTSAGMTTGIDLALAMVEQELGADVARAVARQLVVYHRRAGGQSQFSALLELEPKSDRIQSALAYAKRNLDKPPTVGQLAEAAHRSGLNYRVGVTGSGYRPVSRLWSTRRSRNQSAMPRN